MVDFFKIGVVIVVSPIGNEISVFYFETEISIWNVIIADIDSGQCSKLIVCDINDGIVNFKPSMSRTVSPFSCDVCGFWQIVFNNESR